MASEYDVVVIGSGPGGYVCAIRCAQLGMKTALVEKYATLGGTCLNVGCIPSKAWLDSSERYHQMAHEASVHGIEVGSLKLDVAKMSSRVEQVVREICMGVEYLIKKNKIDHFKGIGKFVDQHTVEVQGETRQIIKAKNIVVATGSRPSSLPGLEIDKKRVITSTEALKLKECPKHLIVIGGGVIGLEMGSVFLRLGAKVSVVEYADGIIPTMDQDLSKHLLRSLKKQGMDFYLGHGVSEAKNLGKTVVVKAKSKKNEKEIVLEGDYCLVAVGRKAFTTGLALEQAGVALDDRGRIETNPHLQTNVSHIYAIGDVTKGAMLAHKAEEEGVFVAEFLAGQKPHLNYNLIPGVVYTWPEVAGVGQTEQDLVAQGIPYKSGNFPVKALGRAKASNESEGFVKILAHQKTDEVLGVHMMAPRASDLIAEAVLAMEYRASAEDIARTCHAHPTYSEALKEAALAATDNRAIHT